MKKNLLCIGTLSLALLLFTTSTKAQLADGSTAPDFTSTDINGNSYSLYADFLDSGKAVILDISATWCGPCWSYHNNHALKDLYTIYGPDGSNEVGVFLVEGDGSTNLADLEGTGSNTLGDWITGTPYPIIDDNNLSNLYQIEYFPTIYGICPDGTLYLFGQQSANEIINLFSSKCNTSLQGVVNNAAVSDHTSKVCLAGGSVTPSTNIYNYGTNNLTSLTLELFEEGNPIAIDTLNWQGNVSSLNSTQVFFDAIDNVSTSANLNVTCSMPNGVADAYPNGNEAEILVELAPFTNENTITVTIKTDKYPGETSWSFKDGNGTILSSFGPYTAGTEDQWGAGGPDAYQTFEYPIAIPEGIDCYTLNVYDSFGDGIAISSSESGYSVSSASGFIINALNKPNFGAEVNEIFGADSDGNSTIIDIPELTSFKTSVYPNPILSEAILSIYTIENSNASLEVVNILGQTVIKTNIKLVKGENTLPIDMSNFEDGLYSLKVESKTVKLSHKIVKTSR